MMRRFEALPRIYMLMLMVAGLPAPGGQGAEGGAGGELVLVRDGQATATIVIAEQPSENARLGAAELQKYIEKITGAKLPVRTDAEPSAGTLILVGRSRLTDQMPNLDIPAGRTKDLREEGLLIQTAKDRLVLAGNDIEPYYGTRYAVAEFLHRLGVRWFLPGEFGEVIPKMASIAVGPTRVLQRPDFPLRTWWEHARDNMEAECREWKIHNKMNDRATDIAFGVPGDSSIQGFLPKEQFKDHPEWFALQRDGTRSIGHPCTTSEGMIQHFVTFIKDRARAGQKISSFAPDDGLPRCWCDHCARIGNAFDGYGSNDRDPVPDASVSNEWFYFVNRIMTEVNKEFPEHIISTNGYANRDVPPEMPAGVPFNPDRNLTVMFANICACTIHAYDDPKCWQMQRQGQMVRQWCRLSDKVWMYNYNYTMLVSKHTLTPMVHRLRRNIPLLKEWGVIGFHDQDEADWAITGLPTRNVRAALEWDTDLDVDAFLDDFYAQWFGRSAAPMKAYYQALEDAFENAPQHGHEDVILPAIYSDALMTRLDTLFRQAEAAAQSDAEKQRMRLESLIFENLCEYVAMEKAKRAGDLAAALKCIDRMLAIRDQQNKITPFMGWVPYACYGTDWEKTRLEGALAKTNGTQGELVTWLPEKAAFRTDPFDDGRYERWQEPSTDLSPWTTLLSTYGWDAQSIPGLVDEKGHPYRGVAWYQFDVDVPESANGKTIFLHGLAVVNEAWVWVNGRYAGRRPYQGVWFRPHTLDLDVSKVLEAGQSNRITLRVLCNWDVWGANGVYERMFLYAGKPGGAPVARQD
ncbi:MAG: hypothetical protein AMXMBFR13_11580 [Phycisphaerae bacterium]